MIKNNLKKSVIITGASTTGKTTLCRRLLTHFNVQALPVHTTRKIREGEINDIDMTFVSEEEYKNNFSEDLYLEETEDSGYFGGAYYGCPKKWVSDIENNRFSCFVCPTVKMAQDLKNELKDKIFWIHLIADENIRKERLFSRDEGISVENLEKRLNKGSEKINVNGNDFVIDTSKLKPWEIFFSAMVKI